MLAESDGLLVGWTVDDIVAIDLLGSPVLGVCFEGDIHTRLEGFGGLQRKERIVEVCSGKVGQRVQLLYSIEERGSCLWP